MRRVCMDCKKFMGYKCGHCGGLGTRELPVSPRGFTRRLCVNLGCQKRFDPNDCPQTQSLCEECATKRKVA